MSKKDQKSQQQSYGEHAGTVAARRLWNSEYQRGFQEGHDAAIKSFAGHLDNMLTRFDNIATSKRF